MEYLKFGVNMFKYTEESMFSGYKLILTLQKGEEIFTVDFDFAREDHNIFDNGKFIGRCRLRDFHLDGWKCIKREVVVY